MTTATYISPIALQRAGRQLWKAAETPTRADQFIRAYRKLVAATFEFEDGSLTVASASEPGKTYRVVGGNCHCDGWKHREQCWHSDAWRVVNLASQIMDEERKAAEAELWG